MSQWEGGRSLHGVLPILATVLAAIVGVGAFGQASRAAKSAAHDRDYPAPYDNSKADRVLKAFDEGHPKCALWTDWHKLCSRTGPNGSTYCRTDPGHPAEPSAPFCAIDPVTELDWTSKDAYYPESRDEVSSKNRFSELTHLEYCPDCGVVRKYQYDRPFNGLSLSSVSHSACKIWRNPNIINPKSEVKFPLFCKEYSRKYTGCKNIGMNYRIEYRQGYNIFNFPKRRGLRHYQVVAGMPLPDSAFAPIWGLHCFATDIAQ
jgi:rubredoxin